MSTPFLFSGKEEKQDENHNHLYSYRIIDLYYLRSPLQVRCRSRSAVRCCLHDWYAEGLIDPDFYSDRTDFFRCPDTLWAAGDAGAWPG